MQNFFTDSNELFKEFKHILSSPRRIVITTHQNPDADALGSSLALYHYLVKKGHQVQVITPTDYPDFLRWMPAENLIINFESEQQNRAKSLIQEAEILFCLDFSALGRIKLMSEWVLNAQGMKVLIDHHQAPEDFAKFVFWNEKAAATCELIYQLIEKLGDKSLIDNNIGQCIYSGIITDTGSFRFDSTSAEVHRITGELIDLGIKTNAIHRKIYDNNSIERMKFLGFVLSEKLVVLPEYHVAYMALSKEELSRFSSKNGDTEGIVNYGLSIKGVVMAVMFTEKDDMIRISFRSVENFAVSELARKYFDGGGHKNASGGRSEESLEATVNKFLSILPEYQESLRENNN